MVKASFVFGFFLTLCTLKTAAQLHFRPAVDSLPPISKFFVLPQNFYTQHKGFICKKEDQLQKYIGLNLFIRLGSKNYVDYLEQKPNTSLLLSKP